MMLRGGKLACLSSRVVGAKSFSTEIFVSRLSFYTTDEELKNIFSPFGAIEQARLVRDNQTGRPKGFGFVRYSSEAEAEKAIKAIDRRIIRGRLIFVEMAKKTQLNRAYCISIVGKLEHLSWLKSIPEIAGSVLSNKTCFVALCFPFC
ncbi:hypothetical protein GUJ93_ZPchr0006g43009 [Zizania palustris]|uniref:RRM domain-containing protein n=1 Tax=Zizania palustris TaxID=103762 RepID=A0A8J5VP15_ZIZPA|nr:hypothetical protein GUJ93_ZPchr0006g43009 [Zizania palustris]